jgi:hypothetical protein
MTFIGVPLFHRISQLGNIFFSLYRAAQKSRTATRGMKTRLQRITNGDLDKLFFFGINFNIHFQL